MLRALAVDDEQPSLEELLYLLNADPRVSSAEGASDATEALRRINRALESGPDGPEAIDVVFLDIHMPGLDGLDLARLLTGFAQPPLVVFVTAHEGFAVQAFDLKAVDYVLKPVRRERLAEAVRRAAQLRDTAPLIPVHEPDPDHISVELGGVTRFVAVEDITHVEAHGDYARLHTAQGNHLVRIPLSTLEERWRSRGFVRIHRRHRRAAPHRRTPPGRGHGERPRRLRRTPGQPPARARTARPAAAPDHELRSTRVPQDPTERRVVVTGVPRRTRRTSGYYRPRTEIDEQTTLGHTYVRSLMRSQLRVALAVFAVLVLLVGPLPLVFAAMPDGASLEWVVLGFCVYPPLVLLARWYVRRAERNEKDFVRLVEDR